jgi:G:T-mismatch repair DNA endonuclease (very short patch repair protein)
MSKGIRLRQRHSEETKRKIAAGNTGKIFSHDRRQSISKANTKHIDLETIEKIRTLLEEKACNLDAVLAEVGTKNGKSLKREMKAAGISLCENLKYFNREITYQTGKKLLAYLRLGIHPKEICERLDLKEKTFWGSAKKLQDAHCFKYEWARKKPGGDSQSTPEKKTCALLDEIGITYTKEYSLGNFYYDIHITGTSLLIEVQGDYWHANPEIYLDKQKLNQTQLSNVRRDHYKRRFAKEQGFYTLYVWEKDLKSDLGKVKMALETYTRKAYAKAADF